MYTAVKKKGFSNDCILFWLALTIVKTSFTISDTISFHSVHCVPYADPEGGGAQGVRTPVKNHKNIGFLSNTGLDPLKITKLPSQPSSAILMAFCL